MVAQMALGPKELTRLRVRLTQSGMYESIIPHTTCIINYDTTRNHLAANLRVVTNATHIYRRKGELIIT